MYKGAVTGLGRDLRIAARRLIATPLFTIFAVLSLAVGVGVTTTAYSVVDAFFSANWASAIRTASHS